MLNAVLSVVNGTNSVLRVAVALLAAAQRLGHADDLEVDAADLEVLADRILVGREQLLVHRLADHHDLARLGDVALVDEAAGLVLERDDVLELGIVRHHRERAGLALVADA